MQLDDGVGQLGRVVAGRLGDHLGAAGPLAELFQDVRSGAVQDVFDRRVEDLCQLQRREGLPHRGGDLGRALGVTA
jgi:hypothetical protein